MCWLAEVWLATLPHVVASSFRNVHRTRIHFSSTDPHFHERKDAFINL